MDIRQQIAVVTDFLQGFAAVIQSRLAIAGGRDICHQSEGDYDSRGEVLHFGIVLCCRSYRRGRYRGGSPEQNTRL